MDEYGEGGSDQSFFPVSEEYTTTKKNPVFPEFTTILTGHGEIRSHFHRFGLTDNPMSPCEE